MNSIVLMKEEVNITNIEVCLISNKRIDGKKQRERLLKRARLNKDMLKIIQQIIFLAVYKNLLEMKPCHTI